MNDDVFVRRVRIKARYGKNSGSSWDSNPRPSKFYSQMLLPLSHLDPWQRSGRQATYLAALPRGLSQIPMDSHSLKAGLNWKFG